MVENNALLSLSSARSCRVGGNRQNRRCGRRAVRVIATSFSLIIAALWLASAFYQCEWCQPGLTLMIQNGGVSFTIKPRAWGRSEPDSWPRSKDIRYHYDDARVQLFVVRNRDGRLTWGFPYVDCAAGQPIWLGWLPLWLPFIVSLLPAVWLCFGGQGRPSTGYCVRCGYDLTGNTSGVCPECGCATSKEGGQAYFLANLTYSVLPASMCSDKLPRRGPAGGCDSAGGAKKGGRLTSWRI